MARTPKTLLLGLGGLVVIALVIALTGSGEDPETGTPAPTSSTSTTSSTTSSTTTSTTSTTTTTTTLDPRVPYLDAIEQQAATESDRGLAYRLVVTGLTGSQLTTRLDETVGSICVGGVFLTETNRNWAPENDVDAFVAAVAELDAAWNSQECAASSFIATDAELGSIVRVPVTSPPAPPDWTERYLTGEPYNVLLDLQAQVAAYAQELLDLGVTVNFGAIGDVVTDPGHFMARSGRTFGDDPGVVAALSNAVIQAHCEVGVAATLKHFPNQGATVEDPHRRTSTAVGGRELWESTGRLPYEGTGAPMVMTGHIFMNDVDPEFPASMSFAVTTGLLREELGFEGVVITDDLSTMRGASDVIAEPGARAVAAVRAGADLVLFVDDRDIVDVVDALAAEMAADPAFRARAEEALGRALRLDLSNRQPDLFPLCGDFAE
ncbi:MAG: hypothetical protein DHS20C19_16750 [Acidimicrobiales bacterium]|nr:MAG: hypothetical protein DHS20C19_16750 [Acidimicrobiales bacterium]